MRRHFKFRIAAAFVVLLVCAGRLVFPQLLSSGDNMEAVVSGGTEIADRVWDRRYYDGTTGWDGFTEWRYNDSGRPFSTKSAVETMIQAGYDAWSAINGTLGLGTPLVPVWQQGTDTTVTDAGALDGINAIVWFTGSPGGTLASAPCTWLTTPATTVDDGAGNAVIPFGPPIGNFPVPGPVGAMYPAGTVLDCGVRIDDQENWVDGVGGAGTIDFVSVMTHEEGHTNSVSHSTVGETTGTAADEATMSPFVFGNNTDYRTLAEDDVASIVRFLSRFNSLPLTTGGRGMITGVLKEGGSCDTATGVSVRAYLGTVESSSTVETFSRSQFRTGSDDGRFELNVMEGGPYTIYARQLENAGSGFYLKDRYNLTTVNSNFLEPPNMSTPLDGLATVDWVAAGNTIDIGDVRVLGCECEYTVGQGSSGSELTQFQNAHTTAGGEAVLGCPVGQVRTDGFVSFQGTQGHFQNFVNGSIEYHANGPNQGSAFAVVNPLYNKWELLSFTPSNPLGYPIGNLSDVSPELCTAAWT